MAGSLDSYFYGCVKLTHPLASDVSSRNLRITINNISVIPMMSSDDGWMHLTCLVDDDERTCMYHGQIIVKLHTWVAPSQHPKCV